MPVDHTDATVNRFDTEGHRRVERQRCVNTLTKKATTVEGGQSVKVDLVSGGT